MEFPSCLEPNSNLKNPEENVIYLPPEIISYILQLLHGEDLCSVGKVCKLFSVWANDGKLWKEIVKRELQIIGDLPFWATSWKCVWGFYLLCRKKIFLDGETKNHLGTYKWANGTTYEGEWKDDKECGLGIKRWPDGARYEGFWELGKFHGYGKHTWSTGSFYIGYWDDHKRKGKGSNTWAEKDRYIGDWDNDQKHGSGVYLWTDGRRYEGGWENDKRCGKGVFYWPSVGCYEGDWKEDTMHGFGKFVWEDGDAFEGNWSYGCRYGTGKFILKDGSIIEQEWNELGRFDANDKGIFGSRLYNDSEQFDLLVESLKRKMEQNEEENSSQVKKKVNLQCKNCTK